MYEVTVIATAIVSQTVEVSACDEAEAGAIATELSMCNYGDFEIHDEGSIEVTDIQIESEWDEDEEDDESE